MCEVYHSFQGGTRPPPSNGRTGVLTVRQFFFLILNTQKYLKNYCHIYMSCCSFLISIYLQFTHADSLHMLLSELSFTHVNVCPLVIQYFEAATFLLTKENFSIFNRHHFRNCHSAFIAFTREVTPNPQSARTRSTPHHNSNNSTEKQILLVSFATAEVSYFSAHFRQLKRKTSPLF